MGEAMTASSFTGYWDSPAMPPVDDIFNSEQNKADPTPWLLEAINPSKSTTALTPLDVQTTPLLDDTVFPLDLASDFAASESTNNSNYQICEPLAVQHQTSQTGAHDTCFQAPLSARIDSNPFPSFYRQTTASQLRPAVSQYNRPSPLRPKRRGRPRMYPRPDDEYHLPNGTHPPSSNHAVTSTREQNRLAAQRFRARHDAYSAELNAQAAELACENMALKTTVASLREETLGLRYDILKHADCGCGLGRWMLKESWVEWAGGWEMGRGMGRTMSEMSSGSRRERSLDATRRLSKGSTHGYR